jgi:surface protein
MSVKLGSTSIGSLYLGSIKISEAYLGNVKVYASADPYNPLGLPAYTIRLKFNGFNTPTFSKGAAVQVSSSPNVWDLTYSDSDWSNLLQNQYSLIEVLGANTSSVTTMEGMFAGCQSLTTIPVFDTHAVTNMSSICNYCSSLTNVPLLNTSSVQAIGFAFNECRYVESGAYALYQQVSSQSPQPYFYSNCFTNCGINTTTGAADLARIPSGWK